MALYKSRQVLKGNYNLFSSKQMYHIVVFCPFVCVTGADLYHFGLGKTQEFVSAWNTFIAMCKGAQDGW